MCEQMPDEVDRGRMIGSLTILVLSFGEVEVGEIL